jgi:PIN domain nuclease of toxin-antitoxin system
MAGAGECGAVLRGSENDQRRGSVGSQRIAAITVWEIALSASRNRIVLIKPATLWVEEAVAASTVSVQPLSPSIAVESWELPGTFHPDLADRPIVATACVTGAVLTMRDPQILDYAARGHLTAIAA